ncbi:MAG: hypothetical protein OEY94_09175 [Alphaproteobacteria bacterium]|nr:hypothetical protein [Alphaproteobacteria bacterium]
MSEITIQVKFFGAFRKFGDSLNFSVPSGSTVAAAKTVIQKMLDGEKLVLDSVLSSHCTILQDNDILENDAELSILPPVCGG